MADTDNKVGRTKIDPTGKISLIAGYSTQHAGYVYRLLNPKTSRVIHSRDVKWIGKMWAEFYKIKMIDRASGYVDPDEDFQLEEEEDQDIEEEELEPEEDESEIIQVGQSQSEEPTETTVGVADDEQLASRTRSQTAADEPIAARTRQALGSDPEMSAFADVKDEKTLNEFLHEIAFVVISRSILTDEQSHIYLLTGFYPSPKSFWSCTHVNSFQYYTLYINLHILLNILCKTTFNIQESRKSLKCLKR